MTIETYTDTRENFKLILRCYDATRLPVAGLVKRYRGTHIDDFGNRQMIFVSSTETANENGEVTWQESLTGK